MGIVYKARDTRLNRLVAIKFLPADNVANEDRLLRFTQEARTASGLNHPNIITIHDIATEAGKPFIVMEYVQGKTLDSLIPRNGMRLNESLKISIQIADALAAAAAAGVIHRDIKPGNVMVGDTGRVKVLDFGLAKVEERASVGDADLPTVPLTPEIKPRTEQGRVLGTISYMSPEQAEGKAIDTRSDIFSFGALLYEMTTGQRPFRGDTMMSVISAILRDDPRRVSEIAPDVPRDLEKIINRCLRKDPERRFQHMADVRVALVELKEESDSGSLQTFNVTAPSQKAAGRRWMVVAGLLLILSVAAVVGTRALRKSPAVPEMMYAEPLTSYNGQQGTPTFSPDGNQIAFPWTGDRGDTTHIYVKLIGADAPLRITNAPENDIAPAWSPDGKSIAFVRNRPDGAALYQVPPIGGVERRITEIGGADINTRVSWSKDGKWLVTSTREPNTKLGRLLAVSVLTGDSRALTIGNASATDQIMPALSPDSRRMAFMVSDSDLKSGISVVTVDENLAVTSSPRPLNVPLGVNAEPVWSSDGREIIFVHNRAELWRVPADSNEPARRVAINVDGLSSPAIASTGNRLVARRNVNDVNIWQVPVNGPTLASSPVLRIASTRMDRAMPGAYSPDASKIAFESNRSGTMSVWLSAVDGANASLFASAEGGTTGSPSWSPDGKWLAVDSRKTGNPELYIISAEGGVMRRLTDHPADDVIPSWSKDGEWIYFSSNRTGRFELFKMPARGVNPVQMTNTGGWSGQASPDGRFIYYTRRLFSSPFLVNAISQPLYRKLVDGGAEEKVLDAVYERSWAVGSDGIWFLAPESQQRTALRYSDLQTRKMTTVTILQRPALLGLTLSPDGKSIMFNQIDHAGSEMMLVEKFH